RHAAGGRVDGRGTSRPGQRSSRAAALPRPAAQAELMPAPLARNRERLGIALGVVLGLVLAFVDSRPGFDATGITAVLLIAAALVSVLVAGPALARAGSPIPTPAPPNALTALSTSLV